MLEVIDNGATLQDIYTTLGRELLWTVATVTVMKNKMADIVLNHPLTIQVPHVVSEILK